jgi:hypothetical protein
VLSQVQDGQESIKAEKITATCNRDATGTFPYIPLRKRVPQRHKTTLLEFLAQIWKDSLPTDLLLSAASVLVVAVPSLEVPEGLMNYSVCNKSSQASEQRHGFGNVHKFRSQEQMSNSWQRCLSTWVSMQQIYFHIESIQTEVLNSYLMNGLNVKLLHISHPG